MVTMKIHCGACGGSWEVYFRDAWKEDHVRKCPHCFAEIDLQTWENQVLPAFAAASDANAELLKDNMGYNRILFSVDFIAEKSKERRKRIIKKYRNPVCPDKTFEELDKALDKMSEEFKTAFDNIEL